MATYRLAYRLTISAPKSVDATEATVLTPAAGAAHSDSFKVTTLANLSGWKPYLGLPRGRTGRIEVLSKRTDVGAITFPLLDAKVPNATGQLTRWVTAFFGDADGRSRWVGLKAFAEQSIDGGATWIACWTGRVQSFRADGKLQWAVSIRDMSEDLKMRLFVGTPHASVASYAAAISLLPLGVQVAYGTLVPPPVMTGAAAFQGLPTNGALGMAFNLDPSQTTPRSAIDNIITYELFAGTGMLYDPGGPANQIPIANFNYSGKLRTKIKWTSGALNGQTGIYRVGYVNPWPDPSSGRRYVKTLYFQVLPDAAMPGYLGLPAANDTGQIIASWIDIALPPAPSPPPMIVGGAGASVLTPTFAPPTTGAIFLSDIHPVQLLADICDGYYGYLYQEGETRPAGKNLGDPKRAVKRDTAAFAALIADTSFPKARFMVTKSENAGDWVEKYLCQPYMIGYYLDGSGQLVPVDLRRPTSIPGTTLTDADVVADEKHDWLQSRDGGVTRVNAKWYRDVPIPLDTVLGQGESVPHVANVFLKAVEMLLVVLDVGTLDLGDQPHDIDGLGYRSMDGELFAATGARRDDVIQGQLEGAARHLTQPFGSGPMTIQLALRRTVTLKPADLAQVAVSWLPDPVTHVRGGTRIMRLLEKSESGSLLYYDTRWLDYGVATTAGVPTIGAPALESGNTAHGITVSVTLNAAGQAVLVNLALTPTSQGTAPAATDAAWGYARIVTASGTQTFKPLPAGYRVWVRGRSFPAAYDEMHQPSAWVVTASVDLAALTAPTGLSVTNIGSTSAQVNWTAGDANLATEVQLSQPNGQPYVRVKQLGPTLGIVATNLKLAGLDPSTTIGVRVAHTDGAGGYSAFLTTTFATLAANNDPVLLQPPTGGQKLRLFT